MRERVPASWENMIIGGCITAVSLVLTVCLMVLLIGGMFWGLAYMSGHWPS